MNAIGSKCIDMLVDIVNASLRWWDLIISATGLKSFWIAVVILVALFSIVLVPMRSGQLLGGGAIGTFARTKINNRRRRNNQTGDD